MLLNNFTPWNIKNTISEINKDIFSYLKEEKNFSERKTILNFPGMINTTYIQEYDLTFVTNIPEIDNEFFIPYISKKTDKKKALFYLPGLDMSAISFYPYYLHMDNEYDIHTIVSGFNSTSSYTDICYIVKNYINRNINKELIIMGESFGALVAIETIIQIQNYKNVKLILINPATSYLKSMWPEKIKKLKNNLTTTVLFDVLGYGPSVIQIFKTINFLKKKYPLESKYHTYAYFYILINLFNMPVENIQYRIKNWIEEGINIININNSIEKIKCKTLLLAGENDDFLPSSDEVQILYKKIKNSKYFIIKDSAHYISYNNCNIVNLINKYLIS
jgi:pimeloyl-ACP methyl ester carboxylesterase